MSPRLLLAAGLLAGFAAAARADFYFNWTAPSSVNTGQGYSVTVDAYFEPYYGYDDSYAVLGLYRNGGQVGGGSTGPFGWASATHGANDGTPQTVAFTAETYSYYGETGYSSHTLTVNGVPANQPPSAWVTVDGHGHGATVTRPYGGSVDVTVRYKASDPDNNLARIRPQVWHPSGHLNNNGGNFIGQSGGYGEVAWTVTLNENGNWHFWTDAEDSDNVFVNSGAWGDGFRLTVVEGAPPSTPPTVTLLAPGAQTVGLGTSLQLTTQATDPDGNLVTHNLDIQRPDGNWNWYGGFAYGEPYMGGPIGSGSNSTRSASFTFDQLGTWYVRSYAHDSTGHGVHSGTVAITVGAPPDTTPPGNPHNLLVSGLNASSFTLSWSAPSGEAAAGYQVRLNEGAATAVSGLSHTFTGLAADTSYAVQVRARDAAGNWSGWAGAGVTTGGSGSGGTQTGGSLWFDATGDGIRDEIVRPNTGTFSYYVNTWYTQNYAYANFPINDYWDPWDTYWPDEDFLPLFVSMRWFHVPIFWVEFSTHFEVAIEVATPPGEPFRIYRDGSGSAEINLNNWQLIFNGVGAPGGLTVLSHFLHDPIDLQGAQYFMVKQGYAINSASIQGANGASSVSAGGTATVTLPANGQLMIETINVQGEEIPIAADNHTLTWILEKVVNGVTHAINGAGKLIDVSPILPLPNGQMLVKLKLDNSDQYFTFVLALPNVTPASSVAFVRDSQNDHIVDGSDPIIDFARIGHWGEDRADGGLSGYEDGLNGGIRNNTTPDNFIDRDPERFYVRVIDTAANSNPNVKNTLSVKVGTLLSSNAVDDDLTDLTLEETGNNTGVFVSEAQLLVGPDIPTGSDDGYPVRSKHSTALLLDDTINDRSHRATVDGHIRTEYQMSSQIIAAQISVSNRTPDERKVLNVVVHHFNEPWQDANGNGQFDAGESYVDISNSVGVVGGPTFSSNQPGNWGPIWTEEQINLQMAALRSVLAQAEIKVVEAARVLRNPVGALFVQPGDSQTPTTIGRFDAIDDNVTGADVSRDHALIQIHFRSASQFNGDDNDDVVDIYFVAPFTVADYGARGFQWQPSSVATYSPPLATNLINTVFISYEAAIDATVTTLAHEILHQLTNKGHIEASQPHHTIFPSGAGAAAGDGTTPLWRRRIQRATADEARTIRPSTSMTAVGNRLLRNP